MKPHVQNIRSRTGRAVPNQFEIIAADGVYFQSYSTVIAFRPRTGKVQLDPKWNCSRTTSIYRAEFLGESTAETQRKIDAGEYEVVNLN